MDGRLSGPRGPGAPIAVPIPGLQGLGPDRAPRGPRAADPFRGGGELEIRFPKNKEEIRLFAKKGNYETFLEEKIL